jgi:hypothetical protein
MGCHALIPQLVMHQFGARIGLIDAYEFMQAMLA